MTYYVDIITLAEFCEIITQPRYLVITNNMFYYKNQ